MNLGFYYHIPIKQDGDKLFLPGYLAVFIASLAMEVKHLTLFMHEANIKSNNEDTQLEPNNISFVSLGRKTPAWHRSIRHSSLLKPLQPYLTKLDCVLVRCPSPLAPYFSRIVPKHKLAYLVVGDYAAGVKNMKIKSLRSLLVKHYTLWNHRQLMKAMREALVLPNSKLLFNQLSPLTEHIHLVKTTTLTKESFCLKTSKSLDLRHDTINILYTGRIVPDKGLGIVVDACKKLKRNGYSVNFHIAGMVEKRLDGYIESLMDSATIDGHCFVVYHGYKTLGSDLFNLYRRADCYVLASIDSEGFPRTIWEAMANSCPVIATKVGSIPLYLEHEKTALLIEPNSSKDIELTIIRLMTDTKLRNKLIQNGFKLSSENSLEIQNKNLIQTIKHHLNHV